MEKSLIATGKTIDAAIESALTKLGLDRDSVSVQVLEQAKSGFFGIGAVPAKVQVTYEAPDEEPAAPRVALSSASRSKPKPAAPKVPVKAEEPVKPAVQPKPDPVKEEKPARPERQSKPAAPKPRKPERTYEAAQPGSNEEKIERFLKGLLENMGSPAVPHAWKESDDTYQVELVGEGLGFLIGRRGETLDAIQHLANYAVNRELDGHVRINVDAEDYRQKREENTHSRRKL